MEKIIEAIDRVLEFLRKTQLETDTINCYQGYYRTIIAFCESNGIIHFGDGETALFIHYQNLRCEKGEIVRSYFNKLRKAAKLLASQMHNRELEWRRDIYHLKKLCEKFEIALAKYYEDIAKTLAASTCKSALSIARQFLIFLENDGLYDFNAVTVNEIKQFMLNTMPSYRNSMSNLTGYMRKFLSFLKDKGFISVDAGIYLANPLSPHKKVLPCFTDEEAAAIFSSVDTTSPMGKRDYAVMKLAIRTGLRGVDVFGLKMMDIDWRKKEIKVCQDKTDVFNTLPLLPDVGNAIMDYILNGRPKANNPYIFLRTKAPYDRLKADSAMGSNIIKKHLKRASIAFGAYDGKTFHAFRRTAGTKLIRSGESLESVRQIMGPKHRDSLKPYIALDVDGLRVCCLSLSKYATTKEWLM